MVSKLWTVMLFWIFRQQLQLYEIFTKRLRIA
jgi:hypothetical protein